MIARHERVVVDIGTGSGQAVLRRARREPRTLVIGVDAEASAMADASRRAAANIKKGGLPNALFIAESAERLPGALYGCADLVTVVLPWGSLLRGIVAGNRQILGGLKAILCPKGELVLFLSEIDRPQLDALVERFAGRRFEIVDVREATESDVTELSSGWARRLGIPRRRIGWLARLQAGPGGESASRSLM